MTEQSGTEQCDYCDGDGFVLELRTDRGIVRRCIPCLAIERGQQQLTTPFERFVDFEPTLPSESEEDLRERRENSYECCRSWWRVLARWRQDDPLVKREPADYDALHEYVREFLTNSMGADAHKSRSDLLEGDGSDGEQTVLTDGGTDSTGTERSPYDAKPLDAEEYRDLLEENPSLVLRVSDGTGDGTYRFWVDDGTLFWRCLNWGSPQQSDQVHLEAVLDDVPRDATTQLLVERATETEAGADE